MVCLLTTVIKSLRWRRAIRFQRCSNFENMPQPAVAMGPALGNRTAKPESFRAGFSRRSPGHAGDQIRAGHQHEDRQEARHCGADLNANAGRRGDRLKAYVAMDA